MAPERLKGDKYFADTDLWSLGVVLIECATGICPYPMKAGFWDML
jgi:serine/threonine protein kinase